MKYLFMMLIFLISNFAIADENIRLYKTEHSDSKMCLVKNLVTSSNNGTELFDKGVSIADDPTLKVQIINKQGLACYYFYYQPSTFFVNVEIKQNYLRITEMPGSLISTNWREYNYMLDIKNGRLIYKSSYDLMFEVDEQDN